jgi:ankyrin repeat protein
MVHTILRLEGELRDDPSRDGMTAFSIALSKGNDSIVELILQSKVEPRVEMEALHKAFKTNEHNTSASVDHKYVLKNNA